MYFGLVDWWTGGLVDWWTGGLTSTKKKIPKSTGGLVTSTFFELDWGLVLVPFKMYWCTRWILDCLEVSAPFD